MPSNWDAISVPFLVKHPNDSYCPKNHVKLALSSYLYFRSWLDISHFLRKFYIVQYLPSSSLSLETIYLVHVFSATVPGRILSQIPTGAILLHALVRQQLQWPEG